METKSSPLWPLFVVAFFASQWAAVQYWSRDNNFNFTAFATAFAILAVVVLFTIGMSLLSYFRVGGPLVVAWIIMALAGLVTTFLVVRSMTTPGSTTLSIDPRKWFGLDVSVGGGQMFVDNAYCALWLLTSVITLMLGVTDIFRLRRH